MKRPYLGKEKDGNEYIVSTFLKFLNINEWAKSKYLTNVLPTDAQISKLELLLGQFKL